MNKTNLIGACLARVKNMPKKDPLQSSRLGWQFARQMLAVASKLSDAEREELLGGLTNEEVRFLFGIAFSGAIDAIRQNDPTYIRDGLLAIALEGARSDSRETVRHLCLLNHSASKLGIDCYTIYQSVRAATPADVALLFDRWFREGTKDIGMMGFREKHLRDGRFMYVSSL